MPRHEPRTHGRSPDCTGPATSSCAASDGAVVTGRTGSHWSDECRMVPRIPIDAVTPKPLARDVGIDSGNVPLRNAIVNIAVNIRL